MNILVYAAGGGGDIATAAAFALKLRRSGHSTVISCAPWERMVVDPNPGPIKFSEVKNPVNVNDDYIIIGSESYAIRRGKKIVFQAVNVARAIDEDVVLVDMNRGVEGVYRALRRICNDFSIDSIITLDVGGDIIARGDEDDLWSPLADLISLCASYRLDRDGLETIVAVASPGADGELNKDYVLRIIYDILSDGGYRGAIGFGDEDRLVFDRIFKYVYSEAGRIILDALDGYVGNKLIRNGTRNVDIDIISTLVFYLDTQTVFEHSIYASKILFTSSIEEANDILVSEGIFTEYELEKEVYRLLESGCDISGETILKARRNILSRLERRLK
jgi:hypothetical protein